MKTENKKMNIRTVRNMLLAFVASLAFAISLSSCADANGLHDQDAVKLTIKFINFDGADDGKYALPGDFNGDGSWENSNTNADIELKDGAGTSSRTFSLSATWMKFTLVKVGSWSRSWVSDELEGNLEDEGKKQNFSKWNIDLSASEMTLVVDGSKSGSDDMLYFE